MPNDIIKAYDDLLQTKRQERAHKQENYHASSAGMCMRKHYFAVIECVEQAPPNALSLRRMELGTVVHNEIQSALEKEERKKEPKKERRKDDDYLIEERVAVKDLNISGRIDIFNRRTKQLTDIKTVGGYKWQKLFGRYGDHGTVENYKLQLGTYVMGLQETFNESCKQLFLLFYKLGDPKAGDMRSLSVPMEYVGFAQEYWEKVNEYRGDVRPPIGLGSSPAESWECSPKWCPFFSHCGGGIKPELLEGGK
jgi:hypothetical protein|tara:strand:+ start:4779 stop:5534 length:756 start_codon:yes stop_codon:yes gene_type:complete